MSILDHILILAVCVMGPYPCLRAAGLYAGTETNELKHGNVTRARLCGAAYYLHHTVTAVLTLGAFAELVHLTVLAVAI